LSSVIKLAMVSSTYCDHHDLAPYCVVVA